MDNDSVITSDVEITDGTPPTEIPTNIIMKIRGRRTITIDVHLNNQHFSTSSELQVYAKIVAIFPIIFVIVTAVFTQMVELSIAFGILVGAGIYCGSLKDGFICTLEVYLVNSVGDGGTRTYTYLRPSLQ